MKQTLTSEKGTSKIFFPNLDGLRSVAFLMVYLYHTFLVSINQLGIKNPFIVKAYDTLLDGLNGVSIFFVLSGFLITYLILYEIESESKLNVRFFYIRRILRIWPLYYAVITFAVIILPALQSHFGTSVLIHRRPIYYFAFLSNFEAIYIDKFFPKSLVLMQVVTWSVAVEEQFYLIWPLLFSFVSRRFLPVIFPSVIACCLIFRFLNHNDNADINFHSLSVCGDLAVGGICAYYSIHSKRFKTFFEKIKKPVIIIVYLLCFVWLFISESIHNSYIRVFTRLVNTLFFGFIILEQNFSSNSFYKFSNNKLLTWMGKYTYGCYLLHPIALWIIDVVEFKVLRLPNTNSIIHSFAKDIIGLFVTIFISCVSYNLYEKRFLKLKDKFSLINKLKKEK